MGARGQGGAFQLGIRNGEGVGDGGRFRQGRCVGVVLEVVGWEAAVPIRHERDDNNPLSCWAGK